MKECLFLHCDVRGRPYRIEDFRVPFLEVGVLKEISGIGPYQMNHVWLIKLRTPEAREQLVTAGSIEVKGRFCAVIDPVKQEFTVKVHWVPFNVPGESLRKTFTAFGDVKDVKQDSWTATGFESAESTTRLVRITLREELTPDDLPHTLKFYGGQVLVVVPGRAPLCLRCRRKGHMRRECRTPRCTQCRAFGHEGRDCVRSYASVAGGASGPEGNENLMDEDEAEAAATSGVVTPSDDHRSQEKEGAAVAVTPAEPPAEPPNDTEDGLEDNSKNAAVTGEPVKNHDSDLSAGVTNVPKSPVSTERAAKRAKQDNATTTAAGIGDQRLRQLEREWPKSSKKGKNVMETRSASLTRQGHQSN